MNNSENNLVSDETEAGNQTSSDIVSQYIDMREANCCNHTSYNKCHRVAEEEMEDVNTNSI